VKKEGWFTKRLKNAIIFAGLTGIDALQTFIQSSRSCAVLRNPLHTEIHANAFSKVKNMIASAFSVPSFSMVTA
jgi:hypothetical protein